MAAFKHLPDRRDVFKAGLSLLGIGAAAAIAVPIRNCNKFTDTPGAKKDEFARTVNSLSAVIAGIVAQRMHPESAVSATIEKPYFPNASVSGSTTSESISMRVELSISSSEFKATGKAGAMTGTVAKSEFDWDLKQIGPDTWQISRALLKLDYELTLTMKDGVIHGQLKRPMLSQNWDITGTYSENSFELKVDTSFASPNFAITGSVTPVTVKK